ncbi:MAG: hypothetical protein ACRENC_19640, partial [Gemmatimonadaceae bacterium]
DSRSSVEVKSVRFHPAAEALDAGAGAFDPPLLIAQNDITQPALLMDAQDRATALYMHGGKITASRNLGAGWTAPVTLDAALGFAAALDAQGNVVLASYGAPSVVRRIAAVGTTWSDPVQTGFTFTQGGPKLAAIAFDGAGDPVVFAKQPVGTRSGAEAVVCK